MKKTKKIKILVAIFLVAAMGVVSFSACTPSEPGHYTVGILSGAQIPAFELGTPGFRDRLTELMEAEGKTVSFQYQNAAGDPAMSTTIATTFASQ